MNVLITGATGGIGEILVKHLIKSHLVIACGRDKLKLRNLKKKFPNLNIYKFDVSDKKETEIVYAKIYKLDVLINCAGILGPVGAFLDNGLDDWEQTIKINLLGTVYNCFFALPLLQKAKKGKIINFAGGGSAYPRPFHTAYGSSKSAIVRFSETLAVEYPQLDINVIAPGAYKTGIWKKETYDPEPDKWGDINRLLNFIDFLISDRSNGLTGKFIHYQDQWENFQSARLAKNIFTLRRIEK